MRQASSQRNESNKTPKTNKLLSALLAFVLSFALLPGCSGSTSSEANPQNQQVEQTQAEAGSSANSQEEASQSNPAEAEAAQAEPTELAALSPSNVPAYSGTPYVELQENVPQFTEEEKQRSSFETYSNLDSLGRCGVAFALIGEETMPTAKRGSIGEVKPSGWHTVRYNGVVEGNYLYNRCHLIAYQLAGENANPKNLITGTRYLNTEGMLPFENKVADYVERTSNHVLYRVTPIFDGENLVASGVQMEALSAEDGGKGVSFNVYCYNVQPEVDIDYDSGNSHLEEGSASATGASTNSSESESSQAATEQSYILNTNSKKFHTPGCSAVSRMKEANKQAFTGTRDSLIARGYSPCGRCNP